MVQVFDVNSRFEILYQQKRRSEENHATMPCSRRLSESIFSAIELRREVTQLRNARKTRRDNLVFRLSGQFAAAVAHENYHVEDFIQVLL